MVNEEYMKYVHYIRSWLYNNIYSNQVYRNKILAFLGTCISGATDKAFTDNPLGITFKIHGESSLIHPATQAAMINVLIDILQSNIDSVRQECKNILANESIRLNPNELADTILVNVFILFSVNLIPLNGQEQLVTITL